MEMFLHILEYCKVTYSHEIWKYLPQVLLWMLFVHELEPDIDF